MLLLLILLFKGFFLEEINLIEKSLVIKYVHLHKEYIKSLLSVHI